MQRVRHAAGKWHIGSGQRKRRGQAARHFEREAGAGQCATGCRAAHDFMDNLMRQQAAFGFQPLAQPQERQGGMAGVDLFEYGAQTGEWHSENQQVGRSQRLVEVGTDA